MKTIRKILIANRGEIACRVIRTCQKLGIKTVAVYSNPDADAPFVRMADQSYSLEGQTSAETYLVIDKIIAIAKEAQADAIHPGYGFLSENAEFSKAVDKAGLIFIGPTAQTITDMGSKQRSKDIMKKAGVPVIPGYQGQEQKEETLIKEALKIGFPLMVKASAGGGGKGLKKVIQESDLKEAIASAKREGQASFGDDTLLIEKFIENPRHIEIQVFGDQQGHVIHLFERECSLQRRHQKVIEEAPSSVLTEEVREKMGAAAIKAAQAVNYHGAGTVEFILGQDQSFYFLEMNTRLQVEHPVTELITGTDLVEWQIAVASGQDLPLAQDDLKIQGHAMEARVYAEDPWNQFLPVTGSIVYLNLPAIPGVRYDMGVQTGSEISVYYDPMLGKIIAHGDTRAQCLQRLSLALKNTQVLGTTTNLSFLDDLINHPLHKQGDFHTGFIENHLSELLHVNPDKSAYHIAAALIILKQAQSKSRLPLMQALHGFRLHTQEMIQDALYLAGESIPFSYRKSNDSYLFDFGQKTHTVKLSQLSDHEIYFMVDETQYQVAYAIHRQNVYVSAPQGNLAYQSSKQAQAQSNAQQAGNLTAPLPGKVLKINVNPEQKVTAGETLMIVEAMKMEHPIKAAVDGTISAVHYKVNDTVKLGDVLLEMAANDN